MGKSPPKHFGNCDLQDHIIFHLKIIAAGYNFAENLVKVGIRCFAIQFIATRLGFAWVSILSGSWQMQEV